MDVFLNTILLFTREFVILPIFVFGLIFLDRTLFIRAILLVLITMLINPLLKTMFGIPLASHLGEGFAFPSGHMQSAVAFWGFLALHSRPIIRVMLLVLLGAIGYALVASNFHNWYDVAGAVAFGAASIFLFNYICNYPAVNNNNLLIALIITVISLILFFYLQPLKDPHMKALGSLCGITLGLLLNNKSTSHAFFSEQVAELIVVVLGVMTIYFSFSMLVVPYFDINQLFNTFLQFFAIATWIISGPNLLKRLVR